MQTVIVMNLEEAPFYRNILEKYALLAPICPFYGHEKGLQELEVPHKDQKYEDFTNRFFTYFPSISFA